MRYLSSIILILSFSLNAYSQSPHGKNMKMDCETCHTQEGWEVNPKTFAFDHRKTNFMLEGQHQMVDCKSCHTDLVFSETKNECMQCHTDVHAGTLGSDCMLCHTTQSWLVTNISEIHQQTSFPLVGAHATADCFDCHTSNNFAQFEPLQVECINCHRKDYMAATEPNHVTGNYSTNCEDCHEMGAFQWSSGGFNHDFFPLTDGHAISDCFQCHTNNNYSSLSTDCFSCHQADYNASTTPNHVSAGLPQNCELCHTTKPGWKPASFDTHNDYYVIQGAHNRIATDCFACHEGSYSNTPNTCVGCHQADYNQTSDPVHSTSGFSTDCETCHSQDVWEPANFDHNDFYVIEGAHTKIAADCFACHQGSYDNTPNTCVGCHQADYNQTSDPAHSTSGFSTDCVTCHSQNAWEPANFDHNGFYVIQGAHTKIATDCFACHQGSYVNTPNTCFGCHSADYNQTADPAHQAANFPTECTDCHTENAWEPSTFDHDGQYFPIYSGKHRDEWNSCTDCHTNTSNYAVFSCITCHEHNQSDTDRHHSDVNNYVYNSTSCLSCHPDGRED